MVKDLVVEAGGKNTYAPNLKPTLPPQDYDLQMGFLLSYQGVANTQFADVMKVTVSDPPVSAWDPKYLFVQAILGLSVMALGYWLSNTYVMPYFEDPKAKKETTTTSGVVPGEKGYDEAWIPKHHLQTGTKKTRKTK